MTAAPLPVAALLAAALVDAGMTGTAAEATAAQLMADFRIAPRDADPLLSALRRLTHPAADDNDLEFALQVIGETES